MMDFIRFWFESDDEYDVEDEGSEGSDRQSDTSTNSAGDDPEEDSQDFHAIRARCLSAGTLFEDPHFPANDFSIRLANPPDGKSKKIEWKRPAEIIAHPKFVTEGYSRFDVQQGIVGNCWFVSSCASLTLHPNLFARVVPPDNGQFADTSYAGVFHFRFWKYGHWVEVVIDDRLPVDGDNALLYMSSSVENEFWGALLEKAYAKLHGSYDALASGTGREGMVDLTGGITEVYPLKGTEPVDLFEMLERHLARSTLVTAGIDGDVQNRLTAVSLVPAHEYSVTKVHRLDARQHVPGLGDELAADVNLICVRNPWGHGEWNGAWSDNSIDWIIVNDETLRELNVEKEDGEFWMSFNDFVEYFDDITFCHRCPCDLSDEQRRCFPWTMVTQGGGWKRNMTAGGSDEATFWRNPQYFIKLSATGEDYGNDSDDPDIRVIVGLMQKHHRRNGTDYLPIRMLIYPIPDTVAFAQTSLPKTFFDNVAPVANEVEYLSVREVIDHYSLPAGRYVVIPHTWKPKQEADFMIRIFAEGSLSSDYYCQREQLIDVR